MTDEAQTVARRYVLGEVIGRGGVADVHRAHDLVLDRPVAVKMLRESANAASDRLRFTSEVWLLASLNHRGLVTVLDAGTTVTEQPYLVMELVEGPTLRQVMDEGPVDPQGVADVGAQLAAALAYAHHHRVVHRDVKPGNVLIDGMGRVRLADFGIARVIGDTMHHTRTGQAIGTVAYLSPEQVRGEEVDGATDVYSLGLVLLEALTGERAFPGPAADAAFARLARGPRVPDAIPPGWRRLVCAMTDADPTARPSAAQVARELTLIGGSTIAVGDVEPEGGQAVVVPDAVPARQPALDPEPRAPSRGWVTPTRLVSAVGALVLMAMLLVVAAVVLTPEPSTSRPPDRIATLPSQAASSTPSAKAAVSTDAPRASSRATAIRNVSATKAPAAAPSNAAAGDRAGASSKNSKATKHHGKGHQKKHHKQKKAKKGKGKKH